MKKKPVIQVPCDPEFAADLKKVAHAAGFTTLAGYTRHLLAKEIKKAKRKG